MSLQSLPLRRQGELRLYGATEYYKHVVPTALLQKRRLSSNFPVFSFPRSCVDTSPRIPDQVRDSPGQAPATDELNDYGLEVHRLAFN